MCLNTPEKYVAYQWAVAKYLLHDKQWNAVKFQKLKRCVF